MRLLLSFISLGMLYLYELSFKFKYLLNRDAQQYVVQYIMLFNTILFSFRNVICI